MHGTRPWLIRSREANTSTPKVCGAGDTKLNEFVIGLLISADVIGLPHEAIPVSELESGTISCLASDVRFGSKADMEHGIDDWRQYCNERHRHSSLKYHAPHQSFDQFDFTRTPCLVDPRL